jgi:hypothetical protein
MATFIKAGFWEQLCKPCTGYKGWLNLDQFVNSRIPAPTYKVFTALLTQEGGADNTVNVNYINKEDLVVGQTYYIDDNEPVIDGGTDFTRVGSINNAIGTYFIATSTDAMWGENGGSLIANLSAPTATVLENTIGNVWFTFLGTGNYEIASDYLFTKQKTSVIMSTPYEKGFPEIPRTYTTTYEQTNSIYLYTLSLSASRSNGSLNDTFIEIRVYN